MSRSTTRIAILLVISCTFAMGQSGGGSGSGGSGGSGGAGGAGAGGAGGGGTKGTPTGGTTTRGNRSNIPNVQDQQRPINLAGRVVMDDGNPPSERVSIERVCNGRARREAYTDSKGYFNFTIDDRQPQTMMQDASVGAEALDPIFRPSGIAGMSPSGLPPDPTGARALTGCELRASLPGTTSDNIQLTGHRAFDDPNVGTIVLRRLSRAGGGSTVTLTSLQAPDKARKAFEHGKKTLQKGNQDEAKADFAKAVEIYPAYAEAWSELSDLYMKAKDLDNAGAAAQHALDADSHYVRPYFTLIVLAAGHEDWKKAAEMSEKLLALDAYNYPAGYYYDALANYKLHNLDKADAAVHAARKLDPNNRLPKISLLMATIMMDRNDFAGAVQEFRSFLEHSPEGADAKYARDGLTMAQDKLAALTPK